ncbi:hypothetical protein DND132_0189 [Pseudodesulfovibrio mercurii]|uniref:Carrier domain-containing protein n=1 Tax=Pseudodesulfovibrio mercurii TaxID=641491 RepID=F0JDW7_9BACT|nr:acyl carrier protein [Pseudodesulfovibrio mercurii]EGB13407.1 hypothetical protein DND132_0189 [Pseudodesulfovibrio mercurii]
MSSITREAIIDIIRTVDPYDVDYDNLDSQKRLQDQGMDSLDMMNLYFEIENVYEISVTIDEDDDAATNWSSIESIIASIEKIRNA